ncbi:MAG: hypothetical protein WB592_02745 [Acidimicrobiales bacterium]
MRAVGEALEGPFLVAGEPDVHRLAPYPVLLGHLCDPHAVPDDCQDGVMTLFHLAELPEHSAPPPSLTRGEYGGADV